LRFHEKDTSFHHCFDNNGKENFPEISYTSLTNQRYKCRVLDRLECKFFLSFWNVSIWAISSLINQTECYKFVVLIHNTCFFFTNNEFFYLKKMKVHIVFFNSCVWVTLKRIYELKRCVLYTQCYGNNFSFPYFFLPIMHLYSHMINLLIHFICE